ncbi:MAG: methylenetetrahydrofolate--tRNA-(uracil(54)-C(5))-methyltransferase (FADH(2)-oxidizing) TrmFO [Anaerolineae bacterium]|nr:methylenetetrahydrofolate--tRNA-(uracil(54)-C(5))-methyltransferase (FADH(2)-oxidizing) TrmFO [Anaerolineae bacterium]
MSSELIVIGGGLAGTEAAWQAAEAGIDVLLYEMRPQKTTPAHRTGNLAELVCSNSLGSALPDRAPGLLKNELRRLNSLLLRAAEVASVPAGAALAVDRDKFAAEVLSALEQHPRIRIIREEMPRVPDRPVIIASGPLTSLSLADDIARLIGQEYLYFYDALAPIVSLDSVNMEIAFRASRYGRGEEEAGDYINCPMNKEEYERFVDAVLSADATPLNNFEAEDPHFFEGCLPIEQIAARGRDSLAYGPMRPVGLRDPRTGRRPYAVVQLRQDNIAGTLYNLVGFQTNIRWGDQKNVLRLIPGLENAEFVRMGQMHRNTFINSPTLLHPTMQFRQREDVFFAGQITGVEGYVGNIGTGLLAGINAVRYLRHQPMMTLPPSTMMGALAHYVTHADPREFQPMKANFGVMPPLDNAPHGKRDRAAAYAARALTDLESCLSTDASALAVTHSQ